MIHVPRSLLRRIRAVFRALLRRQALHPPAVVFQTKTDELRIRLAQPEVQAEYAHSGAFTPGQYAIPLEALNSLEGKDDADVELELIADQVQARWTDKGIPRVQAFAQPELDHFPAFPELPPTLAHNEPTLLHALEEASACTAREELRYRTSQLQLRASGTIVATNGRELLWQEGFEFPWQKDILVPSFHLPECFPRDLPVSIGRKEDRVILSTGAWTLAFFGDVQGRFPRVEDIFPKIEDAKTQIVFAAEDARFLSEALPRLPAAKEEHSPVTIGLDGQVVVRAKEENQPQVTELVLARSSTSGAPVTISCNRHFLKRVLDLGFLCLHIEGPDKPVLCQDLRRKFVFVPLGSEYRIPASSDAMRVFSAQLSIPPEPRRSSMSQVPAPIPQEDPAPKPAANDSLIDQLNDLRGVLRQAYSQAGQLLSAIKQHDKRTRHLQTALASLRHLQQVAA